jgi:hypothetical protein
MRCIRTAKEEKKDELAVHHKSREKGHGLAGTYTCWEMDVRKGNRQTMLVVCKIPNRGGT